MPEIREGRGLGKEIEPGNKVTLTEEGMADVTQRMSISPAHFPDGLESFEFRVDEIKNGQITLNSLGKIGYPITLRIDLVKKVIGS